MRILISEDNPVARRVLESVLTRWGHDVVVTTDGEAALRVLSADDAPPLAILDWEMPKLNGPDICRRLRSIPHPAPTYLILLTAKNSREALVEGIEAGADDFLTKPFDQSELRVRVKAGERVVELQRTLSHRVHELEIAIVERQRAEEALRMLSLTDELTGLLNRRGFCTLAEHQLKAARRTSQGSMLVYGDMDGLKAINDKFGHHTGSEAIVAMAEVIRNTFRESDLLARLGGDEFTVLVTNVGIDDGPSILERLQTSLAEYIHECQPPYQLALSTGATYVDPQTRMTVDDLTHLADQAMYECKRARKAAREQGSAIASYVLRTAESDSAPSML
jgi:diguanylate cyclase (GGDEF)-like protein